MNSDPVNYVIAAPGKQMLIGEYAVIEGGPALVMAVNREAKLAVGRVERALKGSDLPSYARRETERYLGIKTGAAEFEADTCSFFNGNQKLGLGSSAALTACAVASVYHECGRDIGRSDVRMEIWKQARAVHNSFQGEKGSGADLAASIFGGVVAFRSSGGSTNPQISQWRMPAGLQALFFWTGRPSSTAAMLGAVREFKKNKPDRYDPIVSDMKKAADDFIARKVNPHEMVAAVDRYSVLMEMLGLQSGAPVVTGMMKGAIVAARQVGGAAKPSGAGGGDILIAVFPAGTVTDAFEKECRTLGMRKVELETDPRGVRIARSIEGGR